MFSYSHRALRGFLRAIIKFLFINLKIMDLLIKIGVMVVIAWLILNYLIPLLPATLATIAMVLVVIAIIVSLMRVAGLWF